MPGKSEGGGPAKRGSKRFLSPSQKYEIWASVSVRGSGTGLTGGAVAYRGGLVVSLAAMTTIKAVDAVNQLAEVEAGVITADIDRAAAAYGLMYAPDPASYREFTIGGNIATNAGGLRCVKYGVTRDSIAGLEVVLADGQVITTGGRTRKNVVGYDMTSLFVGSEGRLGVVTDATVRLEPRPTGTCMTFRATFLSLASAGGAVIAIAGSPVVSEVLELMDRLSAAAVERFCPTGLPVEGAAAILVGQFTGRGLPMTSPPPLGCAGRPARCSSSRPTATSSSKPGGSPAARFRPTGCVCPPTWQCRSPSWPRCSRGDPESFAHLRACTPTPRDRRAQPRGSRRRLWGRRSPGTCRHRLRCRLPIRADPARGWNRVHDRTQRAVRFGRQRRPGASAGDQSRRRGRCTVGSCASRHSLQLGLV